MAAIGTAQCSASRIVLEHADLLDRQHDGRQAADGLVAGQLDQLRRR